VTGTDRDGRDDRAVREPLDGPDGHRDRDREDCDREDCDVRHDREARRADGDHGVREDGEDGEDRGTRAVTLRRRDGGRERERLRVDDGESVTVLEAAEAAGLALPFGCRTGACGTCTARLLSGDVAHRRPPRALRDRHLADGYVLPCVAVPESDCRLEVGTDVARELVSNPWK
jgi:ferredoxin